MSGPEPDRANGADSPGDTGDADGADAADGAETDDAGAATDGAAAADGTDIGGADAFTHLSPELRAALSERGFRTPTAPQRKAIPVLASGRNALVIAPTGTGKTETAMLPVFSQILECGPAFGISALLITPLRALNRDLRERLEWWGEALDLEVDVRHGDTTQYRRRQQAEDPPDVLVTTPETVQAMLTGSRLRRALEDLEHVVVDEIHELAGSKRGAQLTIALERLRALAGPVQRVGLSATVGDPGAVAAFLTGDRAVEVVDCGGRGRIDVRVRRPEITAEDRRLAGELATDAEVVSHLRLMDELVATHEATLVFVNTRQTAEGLGARFRELGTDIGVHHGSLSKAARVDVEERFKAGDLDALLCTSSMELGVDVGRVDHVIQYRSPRQVRRLLQRVGRAGHRRGEVSRGTIVADTADDVLEAMAIVRRAERGEVEPADIHHGSLDTVANQAVGLAMGRGEVSAMRAYRIVTAASPFRDLTEDRFREILEELADNRVLYLDRDADRIGKTDGSWQYFYSNLSMIPDEATYAVTDVASGRRIGTLDERYVVDFAEPGAVFVQRGEMWRIVEVDEGDDGNESADEGDQDPEVQVAPVEDPTAEAPSWTGSEIPVPYAVAQAVGETRARVAAAFQAGRRREDVAAELAAEFPADRSTIAAALEPLEAHVREVDGREAQVREAQAREADDAPDDAPVDASPDTATGDGPDAPVSTATPVSTAPPVPTADRLVVESHGRDVVVNACLGHEVNETLGRLVCALLGQRTGSSIGLETDPYRIALETPSGVTGAAVADVLEATDPEHAPALLELSLKRSDALAFTLGHVAETFGAIKGWRGSGGRGFGGERLLEALEDTPAFDEALREFTHDELAVDEAVAVMRRLQGDRDDRDDRDDHEDLALSVVRGRTPIGRGGRSSGSELLSPENADASVIETVRERIRNDRIKLFCVHCREWERTTKVRRVDEQPRCPNCESTMVAALNPWADDVVAAVRADDKDEAQEKSTRRAYRAASLVQSHGKQAVVALTGRGVGPETAARIINNHRETEAEFYRDILRRERQYARTKAFWD